MDSTLLWGKNIKGNLETTTTTDDEEREEGKVEARRGMGISLKKDSQNSGGIRKRSIHAGAPWAGSKRRHSFNKKR